MPEDLEIGGVRVRVDTDPKHMPVKSLRRAGKRIFIPRIKRTTVRPGGPRLDITDQHGLHRARPHLFVQRSQSVVFNEEAYVDAYLARCRELDQTEAGVRARALFNASLSPDQLKQVARFNYFDIILFHPYRYRRMEEFYEDAVNEKHRGWTFPYALFRIHLNHVMMNVGLWAVTGGDFPRPELRRSPHPDYTFCSQPYEPHPTADIHLAQKLFIEQAIDEFTQIATIQYDAALGLAGGPRWDSFWGSRRPGSSAAELELPWIAELARSRPRRRFTRREEVLAYIEHTFNWGE